MPRDTDGTAVGAAGVQPAEGAAEPRVSDAGGRRGPSRRRLLAGAGLFGAGAVAGGLTDYLTRPEGEQSGAVPTQPVSFYGTHQAGVITPAQDRLAFGTLNVTSGTARADLRDLLREWTSAAARMTAGQLVGEDTGLDALPVDTGEAIGSLVSGLTITVGYGPSLFDQRFGLASRGIAKERTQWHPDPGRQARHHSAVAHRVCKRGSCQLCKRAPSSPAQHRSHDATLTRG